MTNREWQQGRGSMPDRLMMHTSMAKDGTELTEYDQRNMAETATQFAAHLAPKMSGDSARNLAPIWTETSFGVKWTDRHIWFQEAGIRPFTMRNLAGRTIPMWVQDHDGELRRQNPRIQTRVTEDGRTQVLIFRKAAPIGSRKTVERDGVMVDVPRSFPGAPGRINRRERPRPLTAPGKVGGQIALRNVGVRWRHPGLPKRSFIRQALVLVAHYSGVEPGVIRDQFGRMR